MVHHKAHLVAKGFNQIPRLYFNDTFSLVVKMSTVRLILFLALHFKWPVQQLDVKNAFLHGFVFEQIFVTQQPGFINPNYPNHVYKLWKALYGLQQAPRAWYSRFSTFLIQQGFVICQTDTSLFVRHCARSITILLVYVDDILVTGNDQKFISDLLQLLSSCFDMRHLGLMKHFLGLEVEHHPNGMVFSQANYAKFILEKAGMLNCKECTSPLFTKKVTPSTENKYYDPSFYKSLVGALQYITITRLDLNFAVNTVCQHMHEPMDSHFQAMKRILCYLKRTLNFGLHYTFGPLSIQAYSDSDWVGYNTNRKSTTGYCLVFLSKPDSLECKEATHHLQILY